MSIYVNYMSFYVKTCEKVPFSDEKTVNFMQKCMQKGSEKCKNSPAKISYNTKT